MIGHVEKGQVWVSPLVRKVSYQNYTSHALFMHNLHASWNLSQVSQEVLSVSMDLIYTSYKKLTLAIISEMWEGVCF
jgi:hypothetical protein